MHAIAREMILDTLWILSQINLSANWFDIKDIEQQYAAPNSVWKNMKTGYATVRQPKLANNSFLPDISSVLCSTLY